MESQAGVAARLVREWILSSGPIQHTTEHELQDALEHDLTTAPPWMYSVAREHRLDEHNRIDFLVRVQIDPMTFVRVGIEIKIKSALAEVCRQLERYADLDEIDELLLVTTKAIHHQVPHWMNRKPVVLCSLVEAGL